MAHDDEDRDRGSSGAKHEGLWRRPQREGFSGPDWEKEGDDDTRRDPEHPRRPDDAQERASGAAGSGRDAGPQIGHGESATESDSAAERHL